MEDKILHALTDVPIDTLSVAKLVIGADGKQKDVNPTLYDMLKRGLIEQVAVEGMARPHWKKL